VSLSLLVSILIRLLAFICSLALLNRTRDWRMGFLSIMLALMTLRQILTLVAKYESASLTYSSLNTEWPGLIVSAMAFLSVFFFGRILDEHKRADKALKDSDQRYRQAAKLTQVGYWVWDEIEDKAIACSAECARIQGVSVEEWVSFKTSAKKDAKWIHPDDHDRFIEKNLAFLKTKKPLEMEYRLLTPKGEIRHVRDIAEPEFDENGIHVRSVGSIQDITHKKLAEEELRDSHALYRQAESMGNMGHWSWDIEGDKLISCSEQFARIYDMTVPEALDYFTSIEAEINLIYPDDK
jgi:PAS domain S-box-containing protein